MKKQAVALGISLTAIQILLAILLAPGRNAGQAYSQLCRWDCSDWYAKIATDGYHSTIPPVRQNAALANVAFFPAFPLIGRALYLGFGINPRLGLLATAQFFAVLFWAALWILLKRWKIPDLTAALVVFAVFAHPASFYLVSGYSESLFLSSLLLFVLHGHVRDATSVVSASVAGFTMSATRIIGLPVAAFPVLQQLSEWLSGPRRPRPKKLISAVSVAMIAALGALLFLLYSQLRFGQFNLYMETQKIGWGIVPDYGAIWKWADFDFRYLVDRFTTLASGIAFVALAVVELVLLLGSRTEYALSGFKLRLPVYVTAFLIFFITLSGLKNVGFLSMIRYSLPWYILLLVCLAHLSQRLPRVPRPLLIGLLVTLALGLTCLLYFFQVPHLRDYLHGRWFA